MAAQPTNVHVIKQCQILLHSSANFRRSVTVIYGFVLLILYQSRWPVFAKMITFLLIMGQLFFIWAGTKPYSRFVLIEYMGTAWRLHHHKGQVEDFIEGSVVMSFGIFFLLKLKNGIRTRILVIFMDQIHCQFYHFLRLSQQCQMNRWF